MLDNARLRIRPVLEEVRELLGRHFGLCELPLGQIDVVRLAPARNARLPAHEFYSYARAGRVETRCVARWGTVKSFFPGFWRCRPLREEIARAVPGLREAHAALAPLMAPRAPAGDPRDLRDLMEARALLIEAHWVARRHAAEEAGQTELWMAVWRLRRRLQPPLHPPDATQHPNGGWQIRRAAPLPWARMWLERNPLLAERTVRELMAPDWQRLVGRDIPPPWTPQGPCAQWRPWAPRRER